MEKLLRCSLMKTSGLTSSSDNQLNSLSQYHAFTVNYFQLPKRFQKKRLIVYVVREVNLLTIHTSCFLDYSQYKKDNSLLTLSQEYLPGMRLFNSKLLQMWSLVPETAQRSRCWCMNNISLIFLMIFYLIYSLFQNLRHHGSSSQIRDWRRFCGQLHYHSTLGTY